MNYKIAKMYEWQKLAFGFIKTDLRNHKVIVFLILKYLGNIQGRIQIEHQSYLIKLEKLFEFHKKIILKNDKF